MKTRTNFLLATAFVLLAGLGSAMAQSTKNSSIVRLPPQPIGSAVTVNAIEISDGIVGFDQSKSETVFGYSFLGRTTGTFPGSFSLFMNCAPSLPVSGGINDVTGGAWTLPVYVTDMKGGIYAGSLYGNIVKGTMSWDKTATKASVYFVLDVSGTQSWSGVGGYATFAGILLTDEKTGQTTLTGDLVFTLRNEIVTE
jgi:hypothetical protein